MKRKTSLALLVAATLVAAGCSSYDNDGDYMPPPPGNTAPVVSAITNVMSDQDTTVGPVEFSVNDDTTAADMLTVTAAADGALFPADGLLVGGSGATRNLTLTPFEAATGTANITVTVSDAQGAATTRSFGVTVNARPASIRDTTMAAFAKGETDAPTTLNGFTFTQDADDPAVFAPLIGEE
jgi:hypothetical protein